MHGDPKAHFASVKETVTATQGRVRPDHLTLAKTVLGETRACRQGRVTRQRHGKRSRVVGAGLGTTHSSRAWRLPVFD